MAAKRIITMVKEEDVTYLADAKVEFVSLVDRGANRAPFKILKSEGGNMTKVVQAVLVPNRLSEEEKKACLEGFETENAKEFNSYTSYIQVSEDSVDLSKAQLAKLGKSFALVAPLKEDSPELKDAVDKTKKEAIDYLTLDNLYNELYAMADVVAGAMRQSEADTGNRKDIVLSAIHNFEAFATALFDNVNGKSLKAVKIEDHPDKVVSFFVDKKEGAESEVSKNDEPSTEPSEEPADEPEDEKAEKKENEVDIEKLKAELLEEVKSLIGASIEKATKELEESTEEIKKSLEEIQSTPVSTKTVLNKDASVDDDTTEDKTSTFKGAIFRN